MEAFVGDGIDGPENSGDGHENTGFEEGDYDNDDYDYDGISELINKEYPNDWDPFIVMRSVETSTGPSGNVGPSSRPMDIANESPREGNFGRADIMVNDVHQAMVFGQNDAILVDAEPCRDNVQGSNSEGPRACELPEMVLAELNVTVSYIKAWNAKESAICERRGSEEGASIAGYPYLRKVVVIDGTQMKGRCQGCLVAASGQDGNMQVYPLAFGVVDNENINSWVWFLEKLSEFVKHEEDLVFLSDRHAAINAALSKVYPLAHHGACVVHLHRNVKSNFQCERLAGMVSNAARAFTERDFNYWCKEVQSRKQQCVKYLEDIGLPHWTLYHCPKRRYNLMSSNISESLNAAMLKAVDYPIVAMGEFIRAMLMRWFYLRRKHSGKTKTRCTPEVELILLDNLEDAVGCAVLSASDWVYQVNDSKEYIFEVDLENKTCSCRAFDVLMIPCCHALAAVGVRKLDHYSLLGWCYFVDVWQKKYDQLIQPISREEDVNVPEDIREKDIGPPKTKCPGGRPKKKRIPSKGEGNGKRNQKKEEDD
ncbi:uncharacterized protein LOC111831047 [Capsella rubella]|uniref:uncharacterized protein LOC111831047 n=1 Tax=Capsella rubella TaxID=81985 RepID=UPI000CD5531D|nr:uncharacterized protein LOC111831047 [Capsella rubella]